MAQAIVDRHLYAHGNWTPQHTSTLDMWKPGLCMQPACNHGYAALLENAFPDCTRTRARVVERYTRGIATAAHPGTRSRAASIGALPFATSPDLHLNSTATPQPMTTSVVCSLPDADGPNCTSGFGVDVRAGSALGR